MNPRSQLARALLLGIAMLMPGLVPAQTYVIPFTDVRTESENTGEAPDDVIHALLVDLIRSELDELGFDVDAGIVLNDIPIEAFTEIIETDCDFPRPFEVHTDATTATVTIDDSSSLTLSLDSIRSITLEAALSGSVSADADAWVRWGQDIPFVGDCVKFDTDHGWVGLTLPFDIDVTLALDLEPSIDAEQLAIIVDKQATLSGEAVIGNGDLDHEFGPISLTDLVLSIFKDRLLDAISENGEDAVAQAIVELNYRLDGRDENGEPDPTLAAFNGPSTFLLDISEDDRESVRDLLGQYGIPEIVIDMLDERGVEVLLTLAILEGPERELYLAELGAQASCDVVLAAFETPLAQSPLYVVNNQVWEAASAAAAGPYYTDAACGDEAAYRPTSAAEFCQARFGEAAESLLGNAAAWTPDAGQPNDPLPEVPSRAWTSIPATQLDIGVVPLAGNHQPYMKQLAYKTIDGVPRGSGSCALEMRVYKKSIDAEGLKPLIALHGGTWRSRGFSFLGLESGISQMTERGFIVFAPFYRLVGESDGNVECNGATWREVTADVESALDWVIANGAALGANDGPIAVYGQSAGAHLSGWLAAHRSADVQNALMFYAPSDVLEYLSGALPAGGPYEPFRDFGLKSMARLYGAPAGASELRIDQIATSDLTVARIANDYDEVIPDSVFNLGILDPADPPGYLTRCAALTQTDLGQIDLLAPPAALLDCLKQDLSEFLVTNSFNHLLADEPTAVHLVHGSADALVPYTQAVNLCAAIEGSGLPFDVVDPLTSYDCGLASQAQIVRDAGHALELGVCVDALCPAGDFDSVTRDAAATALGAAWLWLQAGVAPPGETGISFDDVPEGYWAYSFIETLVLNGIGSGCTATSYCPDDPMTRAHMAVFLERAMRGGSYVAPAATGTVFGDVAANDFAAGYIEQFYRDGITSGCGGGNYCPSGQVTRAQMAIFLLRAKYGSGYSPPPATGMFSDVSVNHWAARWAEQLAREGISSGCGGGRFCPNSSVTRAQMAVFVVRAFDLQ